MDLTTLLVLLASLILAYLFFRRPKNFPPGPFWFPVVGNLLLVHNLHHKLGYYHLVWEKLTEKYGPLVGLKLGSDRIVLCSGFEAVKYVCNTDACDGKPEGLVFRMRTYGERLGIGFTDGPIWSKTRTFVVKTLRNLGAGRGQMQKIILDEAINLATLLKSRCQNGQNDNLAYVQEDLGSLFRMSILNSQWALISGESFSLNDSKLIHLQQLVTGFFQGADFSGGLVNQIPWIRYIAPEMSGYNAMMALVGPLQEYCEDLVERHDRRFDYQSLIQEKEKLKKLTPQEIENFNFISQSNFIDAYLAEIFKVAQPDDLVFNKKQLVCVLMDLFMAGPETVSNWMAYILQLLLLYPDTQEKLRSEIDRVAGEFKEASPADLKMMPFLEAFFAESLRFSNMGPIPSPHRAMTDFQLFSYTIPKDTLLLLSLYSVHKDKNHWCDPEVFRPERFLDSTGQIFIQDDWLMPFGHGRRRCFGENIAKNMVFIFLVTILQRFEIILPKNEIMDLNPKEGMNMCPKKYAGIIKIRR